MNAKKFNDYISNFVLDKIQPILRDSSKWPASWTRVVFKEYVRSREIILSKNFIELIPLSQILYARKSTRTYTLHPLSLELISNLLHYAGGIKKNGLSENSEQRHYPSGGGLYPLEIYLVFKENSISDTEPGIYHYNIKKHSLERIADEVIVTEFLKTVPQANTAPVTLIISAVWERTFQKYLDFGYKIVLLEAGHLAQNLQLVAESLHLDYCSFVGFDGKGIDAILDFTNREDENVLYLMTLGKSDS